MFPRNNLLGLVAVVLFSLANLHAGRCDERAQKPSAPPRTFAVETYVGRTYNYLDNMVDKDGLPYFDIFWTEPAEAAHDWPDFGDVMSRQLQGAIMARHLTGREARNEKLWLRKILSYLDPTTGLLVRPATNFSKHEARQGDQALTLFALVTAYADTKDPALRRAICKMVDHLPSTYDPREPPSGFIVKSLMACVRELEYKPALDQAKSVVESVFGGPSVFTPDNTFRQGGHMHSNLRTLVGAADYALYVKDPVLFSRVDALYRHMRGRTTRFGFMAEVVDRPGDVISCETCTLMDYMGIAVTLANNGHPEYWGDVERLLRNHLVESQVADVAWLTPGDRPDTAQFTWRDVGARMVGGYAGWSSPTHILAARETMVWWGGPELKGKTRAFQNCCGGSGTHALFIAWKNAARFLHGTLSVNLHIDKLLPQAEIRCHQPYKGLLTISLKQACKVRVRIPEFVAAAEIKAQSNRGPIQATPLGNYLELGDRQAGETIEASYPLPVRDEETTIGNPGFRQYRYRVTWKGDTVVRMTPLGEQPAAGYSDFEKKQVATFYGESGPGRLYQRDEMLKPADPQPAPLHLDDGFGDWWFLQ
jgi:hypothetical protein